MTSEDEIDKTPMDTTVDTVEEDKQVPVVTASEAQPATSQQPALSAADIQNMQAAMMMQQMQASMRAMEASSQSGQWKPAPSGLPDDGMWGKNTYVGSRTLSTGCILSLFLCIPGILFCCVCPQDKRTAYKVDGKVSPTRAIEVASSVV